MARKITTEEQAARDRHPAGKARPTARQRWADRIAPLMPPDQSTLDHLDGVGFVSDNAACYGGLWSQ